MIPDRHLDDVQQSGLKATAKDRWQWAQMRMDPSGIQEPTGEAFTYLMNGLTAAQNWTGLFRPGERVRLRFINTSAQSFYDVSIPGLTMDVVHVHGNDVVPVPVDQFRIGVAETYDVVVQPREDRAYTIFAQNLTRSGYARGTLATQPGMQAPVPPMDAAPMRNMADMGMTMMPGQVAASNPDHTRIDGIMPSMKGVTDAEKARRTGYQDKLGLPDVTKQLKPGVEQQYVLDHSFQRLDLPGDGLNHLMGSRRILTYADLRSVYPGVHKGPVTREIVLTLTGNMGRFIWGFNGKKFSEVGPIDVTLGERFRLRLVNSTMMTHPIHLHGMWMELENGQGDNLPYLHTFIPSYLQRAAGSQRQPPGDAACDRAVAAALPPAVSLRGRHVPHAARAAQGCLRCGSAFLPRRLSRRSCSPLRCLHRRSCSTRASSSALASPLTR